MTKCWRAAIIAAAGLATTGMLLSGGPAVASARPVAAAAGTADPPPVKVITEANAARGDLFIAPYSAAGTYANGAEILSPDGRRVVWFHPVPDGQEAADFREQVYRGQPVLTWWQGTGLGGLSSGVDYIYDTHYRRVATVRAGNGYSADGHEFAITRRNTALIIAYTVATADLTAIGGPADQKVINGVVQEIDIRTGKVLFQWNSAGHVPYSASEQPLPASASTPWDWFHLNAVKLNRSGNLLIDARNTWTTYNVSSRTGRVLWRLGGKQSSFQPAAASGQRLGDAGEIFAWQHDPEQVGHDLYTLFDNESAGTPLLPYSRVVTVRLDFRNRVATLVSSIGQPEGLTASSQGNAQTLRGGHLVVGWGSLPYFSEFDSSGKLVFNAEFPPGVNTYRAYRFRWHPARSARLLVPGSRREPGRLPATGLPQCTPHRRSSAVVAAAATTTATNGARRMARTHATSAPAGLAQPAKSCPCMIPDVAATAISNTAAAIDTICRIRSGTRSSRPSAGPAIRKANVAPARAKMTTSDINPPWSPGSARGMRRAGRTGLGAPAGRPEAPA